jgi:HK97 family phage prohead protease
MQFCVPDIKETDNMSMEKKIIGGNVLETKQIERDGIPIGIVKGYIATFDVDRGDDKFMPGAFLGSLQRLKNAGKTQLPLKDFHGRSIGGFPLETLKEDGIGLFGEGEINLNIEQGRDAYELAKQGVYDSFSIGFFPTDSEFVAGIRLIKEAEVLEGSILDIPMNTAAVVTEVKETKGATQFQDLQLAPRTMRWDSDAAKERVREFTGADDGLDMLEVQRRYRRCFFWYDEEAPEVFASYKLPFTDVIDGKLMAVPRAIFAAAAAMQGARGGVDIPDADRPAVIRHIERYYDKMGLDSPFTEQRAFRIDDLKAVDERTLEKLLKRGASLPTQIAKAFIRLVKEGQLREEEGTEGREGKLTDEKAKAFCDEIGTILNKGGKE